MTTQEETISNLEVTPILEIDVNTGEAPRIIDKTPREKRIPKPLPLDVVQTVTKIVTEGGAKLLDTDIRLPQVIATVIRPDQVPFAGAADNPDIIKQIISLNVSGAVVNDQLVQGPAYQLEKLGVGVYKVTHNLGTDGLCLSIGPLQPICSLLIRENHTHYFVVEVSVDGVPTDMGFVYTLARVIS